MPSLYEVTYHEDGTIASFDTEQTEHAPAKMKKQMVMDVTEAPLSGETGGSFY